MNTINTIVQQNTIYIIFSHSRGWYWDFPGQPVVKNLHCHCLVPGEGTKILHSVWCGKKKRGGCNLWYIISNKYEIIYYCCVSSLG